MDIASACLAGVKCRYDGEAWPDERIVELHNKGLVKLVCPECLAGLPAPRCPSEISGGDGADVLDRLQRIDPMRPMAGVEPDRMESVTIYAR